MIRRPRRAATAAALAAGLAVAGLQAAEVKLFRLQSRAAFLPGTLEGISIAPLGTLELADRIDRLAGIEEPFLFAAATHPQGWVAGTGNSGRVLLIDRSGQVTTLYEAAEPEIFAVWVDPDGTVFAGSSPNGKVYRIASGEASVFFDPGETYIWSLARAADGALLVGTGTAGKLYRLEADGTGTVFHDSEDTHIRALQALPGGDLLLGTAGEGLIVRLDPQGRARTLHDAPQPEVVAFALEPTAEGEEGACYVAVLASEASLMDLADDEGKAGATNKGDEDDEEDEGEEGEEEEGDEEVSVSVSMFGEDEDPAFAGGRPRGFEGERSEILRIAANGLVESVGSFEEETVYALLWHRDRLWVGTGLDGALYSLEDRTLVLENDVDERQVVALLPDDPGPVLLTTNAAALYRVADRPQREGTYTSAALDAGQVARFGTLSWRGELPAGARLAFSARTGMSAEPDGTWSPWTPPAAADSAAGETALAVETGRYVQWRAVLAADGDASPRLGEVLLSYHQLNLAPAITRFTVLDPGQILVPSNFNPGSQVFEPIHPGREGIFTTLQQTDDGDAVRVKPLWKKGYRTLRWQVEDPNGDELRYELLFRPERPDAGWLPLADELAEDYHSFDAMALPDGIYRFLLRASDRLANAPEESLLAEEASETVIVDHTPPELGRVRSESGELRVEVSDAWSPVRQAEVSADAGEWKPAPTADGLLDGRRETLVVPAGRASLLLLRVMDAAFNVVTFDLSARLDDSAGREAGR